MAVNGGYRDAVLLDRLRAAAAIPSAVLAEHSRRQSAADGRANLSLLTGQARSRI
jgi:hypothetical protein